MSAVTEPALLVQLLAQAKLLIFDVDGTLADTSALHARAFDEVLAPLGVTVRYPDIAGRTTADAIRHCLRDDRLKLEAGAVAELVGRKQERARSLIETELVALPGVDPFLRWARPKYRLSICSAGSRTTVELCLRKLGYDGWFDPIVCSDDIRHGKPNPEGFLWVLHLTGIRAARAIVFEDSDSGLAAACAAGIAAVCVYPKPDRPDLSIDWSALNRLTSLGTAR